MTYYQFIDDEGQTYGSFEAFEVEAWEQHSTGFEPGWYWQACFPGCMPDGEPMGPFKSEHDAIDDARQ